MADQEFTTVILETKQLLQVLGSLGAVIEGFRIDAEASGETNPEMAELQDLFKHIGDQYTLQHDDTAITVGVPTEQ